ncbi:hypothetical protein VA7868_03929 [Vibrio aerogenes CECT 7868]|uniref:Uncharacterized protein n=1 Tax=Vibrio aerogenes CECT 7868 TaxID=1216006 RepID=A0A1M6C2E5_9VIBR|nr:hypothetical protein [Vibrio aerogenes]SHI55196.1 hypothetical protein VA7868_03929 [Vibrio aerogenes CECT 7868]
MPIAHCILSPDLQPAENPPDLIGRWGKYAGKETSDMTVTFTRSEKQFGHPYAVIATLFLPSLWSASAMNALQTGLSEALAVCFSIEPAQILVMTSVIESGLVVEGGEVVMW